jgi:NADPH:quinone reductase-like Zn-dependent oxidoreductase
VYTGGSLLGPIGLMVRAKALSRFVRHRVLVLSPPRNAQLLAALRELAESGQVTPIIDRTYPLSDAPEAIRYVETEHARAKVVVTV